MTQLVESYDWEWTKFLEETNLTARQNGEKGPLSGNPVGIALVGLGRMGLVHLRHCLRELRVNLLYALDVDQDRIQATKEAFALETRGTKTLTIDHMDEVLADPKVRAIIIVTPSSTHEKYIRLALEAGKNVMCEKPLTLETNVLGSLYELAEKNRVYLLCGFMRRYDPEFRYLRKRTDPHASDNLGALQLIRMIARDNPGPSLAYVKVSGGLFVDSSIHDIDNLLWYARQLPTSVQVVGKTWKEHFAEEPQLYDKLSADDKVLLEEIHDYHLAVTTLKFPSGLVGTIENSRYSPYGCDHRCEVFGRKGMLRFDGRPSLHSCELNQYGQHESGINFGCFSRYGTAYMNEIRDLITMVDMCENGLFDDKVGLRKKLLEPIRPSLVIASQTVADACMEAADSGQSVKFEWSSDFMDRFDYEISL